MRPDPLEMKGNPEIDTTSSGTPSLFFLTADSSLLNLALLAGLVVTIVRISLVGKGALAFVDEHRYVTAMLGLRALGEGHGLAFLQAINSMGARPGDGFWRAIPGLGQAALLVLCGLNPNSPPSLQVQQVFNVLVMGLNGLLLYRIYRQFFGVSFALLGVALYSSLVNTNYYLRHLLPYDHSLFFFLMALWLLLTAPTHGAGRRAWAVGVLSGFSYAVYPGYFMGPAVLLAMAGLLGFGRGRAGWRAFVPLIGQLAGLAALLGLLEVLAYVSDTSYFASSRYLATTVTQGSFDEGFSFIGSYFQQVEGGFGLGLLALAAVGLILSFAQFRAALAQRGSAPVAPTLWVTLVVAGFSAWLGYAMAVQFGHWLVFYGRILHFFVPLLVLSALGALQYLARPVRYGSHGVLLIGGALAVGHFGSFVAAYRLVAYPADVAYDYGIRDARQIAGISTTGCDLNLVYYRPFGPRLRNQPTAAKPRYTLVNFAYLYPLSCYRTTPATGRKVVVSVPYFMKYAPYQFEGHSAPQRALLQSYAYNFQIVQAD